MNPSSNQSHYFSRDDREGGNSALQDHLADSAETGKNRPADLQQDVDQFRLIEYRLIVDDARDPKLLDALGSLKAKHVTALADTNLPLWITRLFHFWGHRHGPEYYFLLWDWAKSLSGSGISWGRDELLYWLANLIAVNRPLGGQEAVHVASYFLNAAKDQPAQRSHQLDGELVDSFVEHFQQAFPEGLKLLTPTATTRVLYFPTHPYTAQALLANKVNIWVTLPDFFTDIDQFKPLFELGGELWNPGKSDGLPHTLFREVTVRPAKPRSAGEALSAVETIEPAQPLVDLQKLEALVRETAQVDELLGNCERQNLDDPGFDDPNQPPSSNECQ